jgi:hypothetical protein
MDTWNLGAEGLGYFAPYSGTGVKIYDGNTVMRPKLLNKHAYSNMLKLAYIQYETRI